VTGQPEGDFDENFGGTAVNIQVPTGFDAQAVATGLTAPTAIEFTGNGTMFIAERRGTVQMRNPSTGALTQVLDISGSVNAPVFVDQGLLGFALDPEFDGNGGSNDYGYFSYTVKQGPGVTRTVARVERIKWTGSAFDTGQRTVLVGAAGPAPGSGDTCPPGPTSDCLPSDAYTHSAGGLAFGSDGKLWISVPDGASPEGPDQNGKDPLALRAQNDNSLAGKLLRVEPRGASAGDGVAGNPGFNAGTPRTPLSRTWVKGFRNPFRLAERPGGGAFYITDVGWGAWEELNVVPSAPGTPTNKNYAWPCREGLFPSDYTTANNEPYQSGCPDTLTGNHDPLVAYDSSGVDHAIIGSAFYTGGAWPAPWTPPAGSAAFFYSDYPSGEITRLQTDANDAQTDLDVFASGFSGPVDISEGPADFAAPAGATALYVVNIGDVGNLSATDGRVWRITGP
jgi:glucose/arabinose dehydrogenase